MSRKRILIVDDDADLRLGLGIRLRAENYEVSVAGDAITATSQAVKTQPDLVLLDLGLPAGNGLLVLSRLRRLSSTQHIPVIVITARDTSFEEQSLAAGAVGFFQKPVDNSELCEAIAAALEKAPDAAVG